MVFLKYLNLEIEILKLKFQLVIMFKFLILKQLLYLFVINQLEFTELCWKAIKLYNF